MGIRGLGHVAYRVRDYERSLAWYTGVLGFQEAFRLTREDGTPYIIYLRINEDNFIELFEEPEGEQAEAPRLGLQHLCIHVDHLQSTLRELAARGLVEASEPRRGKAGALQCWITDPDGNRIELMELIPGCLHLGGASDQGHLHAKG
ncbi:MAG TPA: VOC family protein [Firmicutes bacterium]|jgi:lactoylglutathione lyase|nr:VOC family protein [Bacillota bacterium]